MRKLLLILLGATSLNLAAQHDSTRLVFGYPDSTKIRVEIELEHPMQDLPQMVLVGLGTIGAASNSQLSLNFKYENPWNVNTAFTFQLATAFWKVKESGVLFSEALLHKSLYSSIKLSNMKMKLFTESNGKEVYYAHHPFQARHQVLLVGGFSLFDFVSLNI